MGLLQKLYIHQNHQSKKTKASLLKIIHLQILKNQLPYNLTKNKQLILKKLIKYRKKKMRQKNRKSFKNQPRSYLVYA
jgi:hypothetical protein